jgi:large subunit ribosomal protein L24
MKYKIKLKKGDLVVVRTGKYKGKTGKVLKVHAQENKVTVDGVNIVKKHIKPTQTNPQGQIKSITKPIWVSKVGIVDPETKKPTRIGMKTDATGKQLRILKSSGKTIKEANNG